MRLFSWVLGASIGLVAMSHAAQTAFQRQYVGADVMLSYQWEDRTQQRHNLVFRLPQKDAALGNKEFRAYDNDEANAYIIKAMRDYAEKQSIGGRQIEIREIAGRRLQVGYLGFSEIGIAKHREALEKVQGDAEKEYLTSIYHTKFDNYVMPDHRTITKRYAQAMAPIARAIRPQLRGLDRRQATEHIIHFFQSIPYDELLNRETSNGAGFQTPYGLLLNNKGDCDTKSVAMASLLRYLYPRQRIVIVYVPGHAFVGIQGRPGPQDFSVRLGGSDFVLADPTGPRLATLGMVSESSRRYLENKKFSYQEVPF